MQTPRLWILLGKGQGGNAQMINLAEALGWPYEAKQLFYNGWNRLPNLLLGASVLSLNHERSAPLVPPWPDLLIAASRRAAPIARWIRRQSGGKTRLVHLFHTQAPLHWFDLVITLPQYRLPERPNVLHLSGALNRIPEAKLKAAEAEWGTELTALPQPRIALIVGGNSSSYELSPETAARLGREADAEARAAGGSLLISTTPRTPPLAADALFEQINGPAYRYRWQPGDERNPYLAFLALADRFIVTVDSASVPMEACATGKPVALFAWPRRPSRGAWLKRVSTTQPFDHLYQAMIYWGLIKPARDFEAYHRQLRRRGLISSLGEPAPESLGGLEDSINRSVQHIRKLMGYAATEIDKETGADRPGGSHGVRSDNN